MLQRRFIKDIFTGKVKEVIDDPNADFEPINERLRKAAHNGVVHRRFRKRAGDQVCTAMTIKPEEATPERIERENAAAKRHGTGAYYDKNGKCHYGSRGVRSREMARRGYADFDAGYGDRQPS